MTDFRETLYTVDAKGNRRWVYSELVKGIWFKRRAFVAYSLMLLYLGLPWVTIGGRQGVLLDVPHSRFVFFGFEFWATDTVFLFLIFGIASFALFFFTAVLGRVWCGWACPETVFLEFLFRPIERLVEGNATQRKRLDAAPWNFEKIRKKITKHGLCAVLSWVLASTALAYFIGREPLFEMMTDWPHKNPVAFSLTLVMMGIMGFQFGWFREQFCTVLCPYARFQSVLMDSSSIVVGYDKVRGEPRGKRKKGEASGEQGECVACSLCVRVCPTGIDIRNGLQMECIACTACVDACDHIMEKVGSPKGLIRYDTEDVLLGHSDTRGLLRPRPVVYGAILSVFVCAFLFSLTTRQPVDFQVLRSSGIGAYSLLEDGKILNQMQIRVSNKDSVPRTFSFTLDNKAVSFIIPQQSLLVPAGEMRTSPVFFNLEPSLLSAGALKVKLSIRGEEGYEDSQTVTLLGPGK